VAARSTLVLTVCARAAAAGPASTVQCRKVAPTLFSQHERLPARANHELLTVLPNQKHSMENTCHDNFR